MVYPEIISYQHKRMLLVALITGAAVLAILTVILSSTSSIALADTKAPPQISIADTSVDEGNLNAKFTVTLNKTDPNTITVNYTTQDGTAIASYDYILSSGTITFTPSHKTEYITVPIKVDNLHEADETFYVNLSNPINATIADGKGIGTIVDDDPEPEMVIANTTIDESNSGSQTASFPVTLSTASGITATVNYNTTNGTATAPNDYTAASGKLTFAPGVTTQNIDVSVVGDLLDEEDETFFVNLMNDVNAHITDPQAVGTIKDNDATPNLSINDVSVTEGDSGEVIADFAVNLSGSSQNKVTVDYTTEDGTATSPGDYQYTSSELTFNTGDTIKHVLVSVNGDILSEGNETFYVRLSNPHYASIADGPGTCTIQEDDYYIYLSMVVNQYASPVPPLFDDIFNYDNHWEVSASGGVYSASILNGEYLLRQNTSTHNIKSISPLGNIQVPYSAEVYARRPTGADTGTRYGLLFDWADTLHYYRFIVEPGSGTFQLQKYASGFVTLDSGSLPSGFSSAGATLKIERDGGGIRAYINGTLVAEASDTTYAHGRVGLMVSTPLANMASGNYAETAFDNFLVYELSALYRTLFERGPSVNAWEISASGGGYSASVLNGEYLLRQNTATHNIKSISPLGNIQVPYSAEVYARRPTGADSGTRYGLLFDWTDTLHYYRFIVEPGSGTFQLQKYDSGFVTLDSGSLPSGFSSSGATLKIERDGGSIRAYINGTLVTEVSDTTYTHGRVGLVVITPIDMVSGNYAEAAFDNFTIKELP